MKIISEKLFINGEWTRTKNGQYIAVFNPANGEEIGIVPSASRNEVQDAIEAASDAFVTWSQMLAQDRQKILEKWYDLILENVDDLAAVLTAEQGKPLAESMGEIQNGAGFIKWYAEEARRLYGDVIPPSAPDQRIAILKQPIGVVGMITPWNFPSSMITRKVSTALAAGCTVVLKPSELTPFSAYALADLAKEAGIPDGVFNIITGDSEMVGDVLLTDSRIKKLSFTGSTRVGKILKQKSAENLTKLSLELGGNAPFIVFEDADLEAASNGILASKFRNAGQTCICANRIFVHDRVFDEVATLLKTKAEALNIGDGAKDGTTLGPMISEDALQNTARILEDAKEKGAEVITGGTAREDMGKQFFEPTLLKNVSSDMACVREEIFGPIAPLISFSSEDEVIEAANDTEYGLAAYIYTNDLTRSWRVPERLEYGMVGVNSAMLSLPQAPFGGVKHSGQGREGSKYGIEEYLDIKYVSIGLKLAP